MHFHCADHKPMPGVRTIIIECDGNRNGDGDGHGQDSRGTRFGDGDGISSKSIVMTILFTCEIERNRTSTRLKAFKHQK